MITSRKNPRVAEALKLRKRALREDRRRFLVEGPQAVGEAVGAGPGLEVLFHSEQAVLHPVAGRAREAGVALVEVSDDLLRELTSTVTPQGLVGVAPFVDVSMSELPRDLNMVAVLHAVRDPGNAGTVLRSADAAGADAVVFGAESVDVYNPKAVRSSAGSLFHLPIVRGAAIDEAVGALRERGLTVYGAAADGERHLHSLDLSQPTAFVFGNEAWGLPDEVAALVDATIRVPISSRAESLNLAAAAAVVLFEAVRQRLAGPSLAPMVAGAAHDIRSPLTAVGGFASTLLKRWGSMSDEQREDMLGAIAADSARMERVLRELVDAARIAEDRLEPSPELVGVEQAVASVAEAVARVADFPEVEWGGEAASAFADPARLRTSLHAMVEAAAWWGSEGPVRVTARSGGRRVAIVVSMAGAALEPGDAEGLFAPRRPGSGAGSKLGLYVARAAARAQGGDLTAEVTDQGIRFVLELPSV